MKCRLLFLLLVCVACRAGAQEMRSADPLRALTTCPLGDGLRVTAVDRVNAGTTRRMVDTAAGKAAVSIADGYRVMLATAQGEPFVKLMIEQSAPGQLDADRATILAQLNSFSSRYGASTRFLKTGVQRGVEEIYFDFSEVGEQAPSGITTLIAADRNVVATVYLLSRQEGEHAKATHGALINSLTTCLGRNERASR